MCASFLKNAKFCNTYFLNSIILPHHYYALYIFATVMYITWYILKYSLYAQTWLANKKGNTSTKPNGHNWKGCRASQDTATTGCRPDTRHRASVNHGRIPFVSGSSPIFAGGAACLPAKQASTRSAQTKDTNASHPAPTQRPTVPAPSNTAPVTRPVSRNVGRQSIDHRHASFSHRSRDTASVSADRAAQQCESPCANGETHRASTFQHCPGDTACVTERREAVQNCPCSTYKCT